MARTKMRRNISVLGTVFGGLRTYLNNLDIFMKYLSFPVLGSVFGIFFLFWINYLFVTHLEKIQASHPIFSSPVVIFTLLLLITVPAFFVIMKALFDYIVAFGALNSMCVNSDRITDVYYHKETIKRRLAPYCILLVVLSLIFSTLSFPLLLPALILALVFFSLAVQIYTLEEDISPYEALRKSIIIVKSNFWGVFWVLAIITFISYVAVPYLICWALGKTVLIQWFANPVEKYISLLPIADINSLIASTGINYSFDVILIAEDIVYCTIATIVTMYMLPFRCACCVELYKGLAGNYTPIETEDTQSPKNKKKKKSE